MKIQVILLHVGVIIISALATLCMASEKMPSATELLDKYTQALDSTQSFISEWEHVDVGSCNIPSWGMRHSNKKTFSRGTYRTDNTGHCYAKSYRWGYTDARHPNTPEKNAVYVLRVTGDTFTYSYNRRLGTKYKGHLNYYTKGASGWDNSDRKSWGYFDKNGMNNLFLGYVQTKARLDTILKNTDRISVHQKPELLNGSLCYIVQADTHYGNFKIWFDSEHGYHPARLKAFIGEGDDIGDPGKPHIITSEEGITRKYTLDNVRFEKIDNVWVPMEADRTHHIVLSSPEKFSSCNSHFKRTKIILNPDHDALESFADPVKDPSLDPKLQDGDVFYLGDGTKYTWQDGKAVDSEGNVVFEPSARRLSPEKKNE